MLFYDKNRVLVTTAPSTQLLEFYKQLKFETFRSGNG